MSLAVVFVTGTSGRSPSWRVNPATVSGSIRINDQFRICFRWHDGAENVEIVDYH